MKQVYKIFIYHWIWFKQSSLPHFSCVNKCSFFRRDKSFNYIDINGWTVDDLGRYIWSNFEHYSKFEIQTCRICETELVWMYPFFSWKDWTLQLVQIEITNIMYNHTYILRNNIPFQHHCIVKPWAWIFFFSQGGARRSTSPPEVTVESLSLRS